MEYEYDSYGNVWSYITKHYNYLLCTKQMLITLWVNLNEIIMKYVWMKQAQPMHFIYKYMYIKGTLSYNMYYKHKWCIACTYSGKYIHHLLTKSKSVNMKIHSSTQHF